jgi:hypothetical protein
MFDYCPWEQKEADSHWRPYLAFGEYSKYLPGKRDNCTPGKCTYALILPSVSQTAKILPFSTLVPSAQS